MKAEIPNSPRFELKLYMVDLYVEAILSCPEIQKTSNRLVASKLSEGLNCTMVEA
jgi:hypothetical protein